MMIMMMMILMMMMMISMITWIAMITVMMMTVVLWKQTSSQNFAYTRIKLYTARKYELAKILKHDFSLNSKSNSAVIYAKIMV